MLMDPANGGRGTLPPVCRRKEPTVKDSRWGILFLLGPLLFAVLAGGQMLGFWHADDAAAGFVEPIDPWGNGGDYYLLMIADSKDGLNADGWLLLQGGRYTFEQSAVKWFRVEHYQQHVLQSIVQGEMNAEIQRPKRRGPKFPDFTEDP